MVPGVSIPPLEARGARATALHQSPGTVGNTSHQAELPPADIPGGIRVNTCPPNIGSAMEALPQI